VFFIPYYYAFSFIINVLIVYSLFNAGLWNMGKGKADGAGFLRKVVGMASLSHYKKKDTSVTFWAERIFFLSYL
jgi:hypothetical protein